MTQTLIRRVRAYLPPSAETGMPVDDDQLYRSALASVREWAWLLLVLWSAVSVAANGFHAFLVPSASLPPLATTLVGVIPPIALIGITELVARLVRLSQYTRRLAWVVVATLFLSLAIAMLIGAAAFAMSFAAVRDFAIMCGVTPRLAGLVPFIIDFSVIASAVAIVAESIAATGMGARSDHREPDEPATPKQPPRPQRHSQGRRLASVSQHTSTPTKPVDPPAPASASKNTAPQPVPAASSTTAPTAVTEPAADPVQDEVSSTASAAAEPPAPLGPAPRRRSTPRVHRTPHATQPPRLLPVAPEPEPGQATRRTGGMIMPKRVLPVAADAV